MSKIRRALVFSILTQHSIQIISLISIATIARLLKPAEIGTYAVASSLIFLAIEIRTLGAGQYLVRESQINDQKIRSASGLMVLMSWSLAAVIAILAPVIAGFYEEPAIAHILWITSPIFLIAPFSSISASLLNRNMDFHKLFVVKITSNALSTIGTISLILLGFSYYALALGALSMAVIEFLLLLHYRPTGAPWLPSFSHMREIVRFGLFASGGNMLQQFTPNIPSLVLGKVSSMADVGMFSRGLGAIVFLNRMFLLAIKPVILPHLASVKRENECVAEAYLKAIVLQAAFCMPLFAVVNLAVYPMIRALFGDQWDAAVPIASILSIWAFFQSVHYFSGDALIAVKKESIMFTKELLMFVVRLVSILVASPYGLHVLAWAMVLSSVVDLLINMWAVKKGLGLGVLRTIRALMPTLMLTAICWLSLFFLTSNFDVTAYNPWISLSVIGVYMTLVWLLFLRLFNYEAWSIILNFLQPLIPARGKK